VEKKFKWPWVQGNSWKQKERETLRKVTKGQLKTASNDHAGGNMSGKKGLGKIKFEVNSKYDCPALGHHPRNQSS